MSRVGARIGSGILGHQFEGMENRVAYLTEVQVGSLKALFDKWEEFTDASSVSDAATGTLAV